MRTRNAGTPKTPGSQKKTPTTTKKSTPKTPAQQSPPVSASSEPQPTPSSEPAVAEEAVVSAGAKETTVSATGKKMTTRIVKKKVLKPKTKVAAAAAAESAAKAAEAEEGKDDQALKDENTTNSKDVDSTNAEEAKYTESEKVEEPAPQMAEDLEDSQDKGKAKVDADEPSSAAAETTVVTESLGTDGPAEPVGVEETNEPREEEEDPEEQIDDAVGEQEKAENMDEDQIETNLKEDDKPENMVVDKIEKGEEEATEPVEDDAPEEVEDYGDEEGFVEPGEEDLREDDEPEATDEMKALDVENKELAAAAKERKVKKELEIFVGGLDREVVEEDVRKTFEKVGEIVEVRLLKDPVTNKNRGFAFVRFATKDQAKRALSEMKNPVICGKRCGTAPNEDNDTLFVGNICNTWTKEAIKQKLKDYSVEGVEHITLVQDPRHEGLSRGFCFIQFACHADAMFAYKRLQKPDVVFGHAERTAKVAFAEPLQEPDPEVMAKVKSVFVDGLPPYWDEDRVRKHFKNYGEIERITLARNMSTAKRKDFGFVDYTTHEAAIACIEHVNKNDLADGNSKTKVRARLSNPLPKTQAVKGGMCGGFRIGRPTGRSLGRAGPPVHRPNFQSGRAPRGPFNEPVTPYGRRAPYRGGYGPLSPGAMGRPNFGGPRHGMGDRGVVRPMPPRREPFPIDDGGYTRPFMGRQYDDPYMYCDSHGMKRPFYMTEQDPAAYMEPSRVRPRFDYTSAGRGTHFRDTYGAGSSLYSSGYYGPDYGARPHSSFNARDRSYGSGSAGGGGSGSGRGSGTGSGSGYYY